MENFEGSDIHQASSKATVREADYERLAAKHFQKQTASEAEVQMIKRQVHDVAASLREIEGIGEQEALVESFRHVEHGLDNTGSRGGSSDLPVWTKELLREYSEKNKLEISVTEAALWLKEIKGYEPKRNNAIGDVLGYGHHCLESKGSGKTKKYIVPNHREFPDFYDHADDVPPRKYYSATGWTQIFRREFAAATNGNWKKSHFRERLEIQSKRQNIASLDMPTGDNSN